MNLLFLKKTPILTQLQIEEALLRADDQNWCIINHSSSEAIVMGISGDPEEMINPQKQNHFPLPIIKRFSGGGTVVIDSNTCFLTFICNSEFVKIAPYPREIMKWTEQFFQPLLPSFELFENDYVIGQRKCGGNAQAICKNRWVHHASLLWDYCPKKMDYLLYPKKTPSYRQNRSHVDFLCRIKDYWPEKNDFLNSLLKQINAKYGLKEILLKDIETILMKPHRKATEIFLV